MAAAPLASHAQSSEFTLVNKQPANADNEPRPVFPVPTERQLKWNQTEFYAFFHYGMNTYTYKEWGDGSEDESIFAPTAVPNPRQWLEAIKAGGMRGGIAVVKHHDGFCLWPTKTTEHNVTKSSNANAQKTNIPRDFAAAAKDLGLKYGFYISPWDRNSKYWGEKDANGNYTDDYAKKVFFAQCAEIAEYGADQFEMWFDGATGDYGYYGGAKKNRNIDNATRYYDIPNLRDSIHNACHDIILWGTGGEARWIGNEAGWAGETCWSMGDGTSGDMNAWKWFPGESDAKATIGGWFYHEGGKRVDGNGNIVAGNEGCKSANELFKMYLETVGRNATLILNFPPNQAGLLSDDQVANLKTLGEMLRTRLGHDLAKADGVKITATDTRSAGVKRTYDAKNMIDGDSTTYWACNDAHNTAVITVELPSVQTIHYVALQEYIQLGQRIKGFTIETSTDGQNWTKKGGNIQTTTVGYKRIIPLNGSTNNSYDAGTQAKYVKISITDSRACPTLHTLSIY